MGRGVQHPCDCIFNRTRDSGESLHLYAGEFIAAEGHLSFEQQNKELTKSKMNGRVDLRQHKKKVTAGR